MRTLRLLTAALSSVALASSLPAQVPSVAAAAVLSASRASVLSPGDIVRITVWHQPDFTGEYLIGPDGAPVHPLYRTVVVAGVPLSVAEERLRTFLSRYEAEPLFSVEPLLPVGVGGEVFRPSVYNLRPGASVAQAMSLAGGPTDRGRRDRALVFRGGSTITVDLSRPEAGALLTLQSRDQVYVEQGRSVFRDYVVPAMSIAGSTALILTVILRSYPQK